MRSRRPAHRTPSPWLAAAAALLATLVPSPERATAQMRPLAVQAGAGRFAVKPASTTMAVGRAADVRLELQDAQGRKVNAPAPIDVIVTITTLPSLQRAR